MAIESHVASELTSARVPPQPVRATEVQATKVAEAEEVKPVSPYEVESVIPDVPAEALTHDQLEVVVQQLQEFVQTINRGIAFTVDQESGKDVIKVTNKETGELVRQIPSEEVLLLASRLSEATGLLVNTQV